ncbi:MAG: hypothetical protein IJX19_13480 [Clostridia bacterium]|nr:hypothetical protein [Clostridia bacterium]
MGEPLDACNHRGMGFALRLCNTKAKLAIKHSVFTEEYSMKKYVSRTAKALLFFTIISILVLMIGVILIIVKLSDVGFGITVLGAMMSILFLCIYFAERSRWLKIDDSEIVLPRGADNNGKIVPKRTIIKMDEIVSVESKFYKGDKIISGDCFFHTLKLKDNTKITFTLYAYGKEAEREIMEKIKKSVQ